jgi:hypothetical protein
LMHCVIVFMNLLRIKLISLKKSTPWHRMWNSSRINAWRILAWQNKKLVGYPNALQAAEEKWVHIQYVCFWNEFLEITYEMHTTFGIVNGHSSKSITSIAQNCWCLV